jgi:hypothetical protein
MIKFEIQFAVRHATSAADYSAGQINRAYIGFNNLHMTKNAAERIHDVARIKIARCDFVQHRRKENEILATDQRHLYVRSTREPFVEVHCRVKPGKSATGNDYSGRLHGNTANRNATRAIKILLNGLHDQSFSRLFLKLFSVQILENLGFSGGFFMQRIIERSTEPRPINWIISTNGLETANQKETRQPVCSLILGIFA